MSAPARIESLSIRGFRSLAEVVIPHLPQATVLIGANGSGKSNLMRFFAMLGSMRARELGKAIAAWGGADDQLFGGSSQTPSIEAELALNTTLGAFEYKFSLSHADMDRLIFDEEAFRFRMEGLGVESDWQYLGRGHTEAAIVEVAKPGVFNETMTPGRIAAIQIGNLFDIRSIHSGANSTQFKRKMDVEDNGHLHTNGSNLASVLYRLEQEDVRRYETICRHINRILPGFDRFAIEENSGKVSIRWRPTWSEKTIGAHLTSDGSLRFFALVTLLNLPHEMLPPVLLIDEPELGLHPSAVNLIGSMIKALAVERQVIIATQSPLLVDAFGLDEILVLGLQEGKTTIRALNPEEYRIWLEDYSTGELWKKNLFGGRP